MSLNNDQIIEAIGEKSVLERVELIKEMEEKFGTGNTSVTEEQTEFNLILIEANVNRDAIVKTLRELTGIGLTEAKGLVAGVPNIVAEGVSKAEAEAIKKKLEEAGAKVELK
jgi:large subunit ribosomal protein L7/L12